MQTHFPVYQNVKQIPHPDPMQFINPQRGHSHAFLCMQVTVPLLARACRAWSTCCCCVCPRRMCSLHSASCNARMHATSCAQIEKYKQYLWIAFMLRVTFSLFFFIVVFIVVLMLFTFYVNFVNFHVHHFFLLACFLFVFIV